MRLEATQALVTALTLGGVYSLLATGLTLTWGTIGFFNLAHGALMTAAGYMTYSALTGLDLPDGAAIPVALVAGAVLGVGTWLAVVRPFVGEVAWSTRAFVASVALAGLIQAILFAVYGERHRILPGSLRHRVVHIWGAETSVQSLVVVGVSVAALIVIYLLLRLTRRGMAVRGVAQNPLGASIVGVNVRVMNAVVMAVSGALAGLAGVLLAGLYFLSPRSGQAPFLTAMIVVILGGMGSVGGTVAAAFMLGALDSSVATWIGSEWSLPILFVVIAVILVLRPSGLGGVVADVRV